jgi:hypothetical protein
VKNGTNLKKWAARTIVSLGGLATMFLTTGQWDTEESVMAVTVLVAAATSFLLPPDEYSQDPNTTPEAVEN